MSSDVDIGAAIAVLRRGGLVAFPTETVYGLGCDAENDDAVRRVFAVKRRPADHPLIVHLGDPAALDDWAVDVSGAARRLAEACWPGPLTLLLRRAARVPDAVTGGRDTVGLRVPAHPTALALLRGFGGGVAAPSANRFGRVSPTTAQHVRDDLGDDVDMVLDGGACPVGLESTIVDATTDPVTLLRPGGIPVEMLEHELGIVVARHDPGPSRAPGMLASHYAPACTVRLADDAASAAAVVEGERTAGRRAAVLDPGPDLVAFARHLYRWLRQADRDGLDTLVVVAPPPTGLGLAIRDRLAKAAAVRLPDADDDDLP